MRKYLHKFLWFLSHVPTPQERMERAMEMREELYDIAVVFFSMSLVEPDSKTDEIVAKLYQACDCIIRADSILKK